MPVEWRKSIVCHIYRNKLVATMGQGFGFDMALVEISMEILHKNFEMRETLGKRWKFLMKLQEMLNNILTHN
jgi:hypothetical protein